MNTLEYLNTLSNQTLSFTDNRPANVIFDRPRPKDISFTTTETTFNAIVGTNIVEIIQPSVTNIRYKITLTGINASINFGTLPSGCTLVGSGPSYTIIGIDSVSDWEAVKLPTFTINEDEFGAFAYESSIIYDTDTTYNNKVTWEVGQFIPQVQLQSSSTLTATGNFQVSGEAELESYASVFVQGIEAIFAYANIDAYANYTTGSVTALITTEASISAAKPTLYTFTQSTVYQNPQSGQEDINNQQFSKWVVGSGSLIAASRDYSGSNDAVYVYNNGELIDSLPCGTYSNALVTGLAISPNYLAAAVTTSTGGTHEIFVYQRQGNNTYIEFDNITLTGRKVADLNITDTHVAWTGDASEDRHGIYTINESTEQLDYVGEISAAATVSALNDDYFVVGRYDTNNIQIYDLTDITSIDRTISTSNTINDLSLYGNSLFVSSDTNPKIWDITTGAITDTLTNYSNADQGIETEDFYTFHKGVYVHIVRKSDLVEVGSPTIHPGLIYYINLTDNEKVNFIAIGNGLYDENTVVDQGQMRIKRDY